MNIQFGEKFSEQQIDAFIDEIYNNYKTNPKDSYVFDLTDVEWISNQGLLLFTGILVYFIEKGITFKVLFYKKGISTANIPRRVVLQIVQIWEIWGIWKIIPNKEYRKYLGGLDMNKIDNLKKLHDIQFERPVIYDRYNITPFVCLDNIESYDESIIAEQLTEYHKLNQATLEIVEQNNCEHPFINNYFGEIISKEIYENFLSHYKQTFFEADYDYAFFSLNLKGRIESLYAKDDKVQENLEENFLKEELLESKNFFFDEKGNKYKNQAYISYSFLDFGAGIVKTLRSEFEKQNDSIDNPSETDILEYAFKHNSSRHPIKFDLNSDNIVNYIPRGLFDVLCLVQRYKGLLIARSGYGKLLYDFSKEDEIEKACSPFGDTTKFFPGTFITIYLPSINDLKRFNKSVIKPEHIKPTYSDCNIKTISLFSIIEKVNDLPFEDKFNFLFKEIESLLNNKNKTLNCISFEKIKDEKIVKRIIFYLIGNHEININNNVVVFHPPDKKILNILNSEIQSLSAAYKNLKIHPLPFINYNEGKEKEIDIFWLGVYDEQDIEKLNNMIYEDFNLAKSDFYEPDSLTGHLNYFDQYGNLKSYLPLYDDIIKYYKIIESDLYTKDVKNIIDEYCMSKQSDVVYYCNGGYCQFEFVELNKVLNQKKYCEVISKALLYKIFQKTNKTTFKSSKYIFIAITSNSHYILKPLKKDDKIEENAVIKINNYHDAPLLKTDLPENPKEFKYILICDVIATGYLTNKVEKVLNEADCSLEIIAVVMNTFDRNDNKSFDYDSKKEKIVSLYDYEIKKYDHNSDKVQDRLKKNNEVIRINPYTNIPIRLSIKDSNSNYGVLDKTELLNILTDKDEYINIGFLEFNNLIHPYFFDTEKLIKEKGNELLKKIFSKTNKDTGKKIIQIEAKNLKIFYPKDSDIEHLDFDKFKDEVLKDHSASKYELERYLTEDGWRFPRSSEHLDKIIKNSPVLILDDGSCTGDSLIQMINEISLFNPSKITLLCIIGRVIDHRREFLSLIHKTKKDVEVEIFFGTTWHIPTYYIGENPNTIERNWLQDVVKIPNTPSKIKKIALSINKALEPKTKKNFSNHKYLPKYMNSDGDEIIPAKALISMRDEIGKVIGYSFFKESFDFFNEFQGLNEIKENKKDKYKELELLSAAIAYEPYIYQKMKNVLPDITKKLSEFIEAIIFGNPKQNNERLNLNDLTYNWDSRDFIHLFFIIYEKNELLNKIKQEKIIANFLIYIDNNKISANYVLYKLLKYFPITPKDVNIKNGKDIFPLLDAIIIKGSIKNESKRQIKIFRSYLTTLPTDKSFSSLHEKLKSMYTEQEGRQLHEKKSTFNHVVSNIISTIKQIRYDLENNSFNNERLIKCQTYWLKCTDFLNPILRFSITYGDFFKPYPYNALYNKTNFILRTMINEVDDILFPINNLSLTKDKVLRVQKHITKLQEDFGIDSDIHKLILENQTNLKWLIDSLLENLKQINNKVTCEKCDIDKSININIPKKYSEELIINELTLNMNKYSSNDKEIRVLIEKKHTNFIVKITNTVSGEYNSGSGIGLDSIKKLDEATFFGFSYKHEPIERLSKANYKFTQILTFKF